MTLLVSRLMFLMNSSGRFIFSSQALAFKMDDTTSSWTAASPLPRVVGFDHLRMWIKFLIVRVPNYEFTTYTDLSHRSLAGVEGNKTLRKYHGHCKVCWPLTSYLAPLATTHALTSARPKRARKPWSPANLHSALCTWSSSAWPSRWRWRLRWWSFRWNRRFRRRRRRMSAGRLRRLKIRLGTMFACFF